VRPAPRARVQLEGLFREALAAVDSRRAVDRVLAGSAQHLAIAGRRLEPEARVWVLAVGKAAAAMAAAFEERAGARLAGGLAVTKDGHGLPLQRIALREAAHPVPDARCESAAREAIALVERADPSDVLVVLLSGGASSLLACPDGRLTLGDLAATTAALLDAGADIEELNTVRKHLSAVAGGRLAARAATQRIELLAISDVAGDRPDLIGSGPLSGDPSRFADALEVLAGRGLLTRVPTAVREHLESGARGEVAETPKPGDAGLARVHVTLLASNRMAVEAARDAALKQGLSARVLSEPLAGEAREAGARLTALANASRVAAPLCLIAGGETTVTVCGSGRGGRSQELALAAAIALDAGHPTALLAAGTDGSDGPTDAAGAFADEATLARGREAGLDARAALARNDAYAFFAAEGGLFVTGPTHTNVMDLALLRVDPAPAAS
jgi:glycerate-2-kinase